jgi:aldose 1-epimerase
MSFKIKKETVGKLNVIKLMNTAEDSYCLVAADIGANMLKYCYKGTAVIDYKEKIAVEGGFTGCPVLYPTPNRVKDCKTKYNGVEYTQMKNGKPHLLHGYAYDAVFEVEDMKEGENCASVSLSFEMKKGDEVLKSYPFENKLTITYTLYSGGVNVTAKVRNNSESVMPYGFAIHPYFFFNGYARFSIPSDEYVETSTQFIPTRNVLKTEDKFPGINEGILVSNDFFNEDFIKRSGENATLELIDEKLKITLMAPDCFKHLVVYYPDNPEFICIENQTCSIDANNMHLDGLADYANQRFLAPGEEENLTVDIQVEGL